MSNRKLPVTFQDVLARIGDKIPSMSDGFVRIAQVIVEQKLKVAFLSSAQVGTASSTSAATVVRFSSSLGLSGYAELQSLARAAMDDDVNMVNTLSNLHERVRPSSVFEDAIRIDMQSLQAMLTAIDNRQFERAVALIGKARTVYIVGLRGVYGLAHTLHHFLGMIGVRSQIVTPGIADLPEQIIDAGAEDVCIGVSFRRYTRATLDIYGRLRERCGAAIAITDSDLSPLARNSEIRFSLGDRVISFIESHVAALSLIQALIAGVAAKNEDRALRALGRHEEAWARHDSFSLFNEGPEADPQTGRGTRAGSKKRNSKSGKA